MEVEIEVNEEEHLMTAPVQLLTRCFQDALLDSTTLLFLLFSSSQTTGEEELQRPKSRFERCAPRFRLILRCGTHIVLQAKHSDTRYTSTSVSFECETGKESGNRAEEKM